MTANAATSAIKVGDKDSSILVIEKVLIWCQVKHHMTFQQGISGRCSKDVKFLGAELYLNRLDQRVSLQSGDQGKLRQYHIHKDAGTAGKLNFWRRDSRLPREVKRNTPIEMWRAARRTISNVLLEEIISPKSSPLPAPSIHGTVMSLIAYALCDAWGLSLRSASQAFATSSSYSPFPLSQLPSVDTKEPYQGSQ